jgi:phosphate starvation-inducible PhoH-like protein
MALVTVYRLKNEINESKIVGVGNTNLTLIEEIIETEIFFQESEVKINSEDYSKTEFIKKLFSTLENIVSKNININARDIVNVAQAIKDGREEEIESLYEHKDALIVLSNGRAVYPKSINQKHYLQTLNKHEVVIAVGPAGTGKTYLGVLFAVAQLKKNYVKKIILVRPVVEAGEKLGFLPGDLKEKIDPYLIPLYDALNDCLGKETVEKLMEKGVIEVAPLAYMRGRTLDNAIIILDEAQNTTNSQMKMFLTRLGFNSKMIITGDVTQIDLPTKQISGLIEAIDLLKDIKGIGIVYFDCNDVMRNPIVYRIIQQYEAKDNGNKYL